ncbi:UvrD-helicase domain-containing protein [Listeria goaensis]|uniref:UvrD-helicase domain-containing protein n=1 Tax=Listeria goaensis TaxID=1649188 RepID=UPI0013C319C9|nr:UvrD-helicase domain-containing protein [Listeria goaensis]
MVEKLNNLILINAPAGSGKTTHIKNRIRQSVIECPKDNILCITYTNRAAEELAKDIKSPNIYISTIHSFISMFMRPYFKHSEVLNLYFEIYQDKIKARILNLDKQKHINDSNEKYCEKFGELSFDFIKSNIDKLYYNESAHSSLYYGGLSHDDLILFTKIFFERFPRINLKLSSKYQTVFIDEYQDTTANILQMFYNAIENTSTKLYLFGDKMQQIYKNYDGSFESELSLFDSDTKLDTNYRSVTDIVNVLNNLYNDSDYVQKNSEEMENIHADFQPKVLITTEIQLELEKMRDISLDTLVLYLFNKERFEAIGVVNLREALDYTQKYTHNSIYNIVDVLTTSYIDNPDPVMKLLYLIADMWNEYRADRYGLIIQELKRNKMIFTKQAYTIKTHSEKIELSSRLNKVFSIYNDIRFTIRNLLDTLLVEGLVTTTYLDDILRNDAYDKLLEVSLIEIHRITAYLANPKVSTQHGVKGESHDSVVFVAENSKRVPVVHMYIFFDVWSRFDISLSSFQHLYYLYHEKLSTLEENIGMKISELKKNSYQLVERILIQTANEIIHLFKGNEIFDYLCLQEYNNFLSKKNVTSARDCFKDNLLYGVLSAYKLFYVGCSRARRNLTILLDKSKLKGDSNLLEKKFITTGFQVIKLNS